MNRHGQRRFGLAALLVVSLPLLRQTGAQAKWPVKLLGQKVMVSCWSTAASMALRAIDPGDGADIGQCTVSRDALVHSPCTCTNPDAFGSEDTLCQIPTQYPSAQEQERDYLPRVLRSAVAGYVGANDLLSYRPSRELIKSEIDDHRPVLVWLGSSNGCGQNGHIQLIGDLVPLGSLPMRAVDGVEVFDPLPIGAGRSYWSEGAWFGCGPLNLGYCAAYHAIGMRTGPFQQLTAFEPDSCADTTGKEYNSLDELRAAIAAKLTQTPVLLRSAIGRQLDGPAPQLDLSCDSTLLDRERVEFGTGPAFRSSDGSRAIICKARSTDLGQPEIGEPFLLTFSQPGPNRYVFRTIGETEFAGPSLSPAVDRLGGDGPVQVTLRLILYPQLGQMALASPTGDKALLFSNVGRQPIPSLAVLEQEELARYNALVSGLSWSN